MSKTQADRRICLRAAASAVMDKGAAPDKLRPRPVHPNQVMSMASGGVVRAAVPKCELATMHWARRALALQLLLRGMPIEVQQQVPGHKKIQTTLTCAKTVEDFQHQTKRRIWDWQSGAIDSARPSQICEGAPAVT